MNIIQSKEDIQQAIESNFFELIEWVKSQPDEYFERQVEGKWSAGQQLDHLVRSTRPVSMALRLPKFIIRIVAGKPNRPSKSFDGVIQKYKDSLANGAKASGPYIPPVVKLNKKTNLLDLFHYQGKKLAKGLNHWTEAQLDNYLLPHPLIGKITIREMLFFTVYHTEHHLNSMKEWLPH
ncbi:MAG: DinB family protein [Aureispira sp.]|nr:DinB family protein [Aureispira sp.]